jgi:tetratricopeptide (TPR) repeat protein
MAAAVLLVLPGLFDTTYTSRLALYPVLGSLLLYAGRRRLPVTHLWVLGFLTAVPALAVAWASIPVQSLVPMVRWFSFGLMIAGFGGIGWNPGAKRSLFMILVISAAAASAMGLSFGEDYPAGNWNRLGPLLSVSTVLLVSGETGLKGLLRAALLLLILLGLWRTQFYIGWIAAVAGSAWFLFSRRFPRVHPVWLLLVFTAGQVLFTLNPGMAGRTPPTLELRTLVWKTSTELALDEFPFGTGTGQARIDIYTGGPPQLRLMAGEDRRIDFLHSDLLTLPVEAGLPGLLLLAAFYVWIARTRPEAAGGALLVTVWPFLASDLPLATPLGALPAALVLALTLRTGERRAGVGPALPAVLLLASLFWAQTVARGYAALERGRRQALYGNIQSPVPSLRQATALVPFEERGFLYLAQSLSSSGDLAGGLEAIDRFCSMYPSYWRGWLLSGEINGRLGRTDEAAASFLMAVKTSPEELPERPMLAMNALACPPPDPDDRLLLGRVLIEGSETCFNLPQVEGLAAEWIVRAGDLALWTIERDPDLGRPLLREVMGYIAYSVEVIPPERYPDFELYLEAAELSGDSILERVSGLARSLLELRTGSGGTPTGQP